MEKMNVKVEREAFEHNGKGYFSYFIQGTIRGTPVKIRIVPPDKGGYTVLDIVFAGAMAADLVVMPFEMKDDAGKTITGNSYFVRSVDEHTGEVFECKIRPDRTSDKNLLAMLLR